jgi:alkylhydroperoxidase family enzyme
MGYLPNFVPLFSERPEVFRAWQQLNGALKTRDLRRYELATVAAAKALRSSYCALSHGKVLAEQFLGSDAVAELPAGLDDVDLAVVSLAEKVVRDVGRPIEPSGA